MVESIIKPNVERPYYLLYSSLASSTLENIRTLQMTQRCVRPSANPGAMIQMHGVTSILTLAWFASIG